MNGTDVLDIRNWLEEILPHHSKQQVVQDRTILHTTLARLVAPPKLDGLAAAATDGGQGGGGAAADAARVLQAAADRMTTDLCGLRTVIDKMWWVERRTGCACVCVRERERERGLMFFSLCLHAAWAAHRRALPYNPAPLLVCPALRAPTAAGLWRSTRSWPLRCGAPSGSGRYRWSASRSTSGTGGTANCGLPDSPQPQPAPSPRVLGPLC